MLCRPIDTSRDFPSPRNVASHILGKGIVGGKELFFFGGGVSAYITVKRTILHLERWWGARAHLPFYGREAVGG